MIRQWGPGHKYIGEFVNGKRDGEGFMTLPRGRTLKGRFRTDAAPDTFPLHDGF
jgi:hypothetical protein